MKILSKIIFFYYLMYFLGVEASNITGVYSLRVILFLPVILYDVFNIKEVLVFYKTLKGKERLIIIILLIYCILHIRTAIIANGSLFYVLTIGIVLFSHIFFWMIINQKIKIIDDFNFILKGFIKGLIVCFFIIVFIPMNILGKFEIGGHYNLGDILSHVTVPFISSTIEAPLFCSIIILFCFIFFIKRKKVQEHRDYFNIVFILFLLLCALLEMLLINRRGPMLALFATIILYISKKYLLKTKIIYFLPLVMLLPLVWSFLVFYLVDFFELGIVKLFVARTDVLNIMSATGRVNNWLIALEHLSKFQFNADYILGIGNLVQYLKLGPYGHAHNSFLEQFIQTGLLGVLLNTILMLFGLSVTRLIFRESDNYYLTFISLTFLLLILLTPTESLFMGIYFTHLLFLNLVILLLKAKRLFPLIEIKK